MPSCVRLRTANAAMLCTFSVREAAHNGATCLPCYAAYNASVCGQDAHEFALQMFKPVRVVATILFLGSIGLIFVGAFVIKSDVSTYIHYHPPSSVLTTRHPPPTDSVHKYARRPHPTITHTHRSFTVFVIIEYLAYTWYTLSYIPYARTAVLKVFGM